MSIEREEEIKAYIDQIKKDGDTIGGVIETVVAVCQSVWAPYVQWDRSWTKIAQGRVYQCFQRSRVWRGL